jgi:hypothetical protein
MQPRYSRPQAAAGAADFSGLVEAGEGKRATTPPRAAALKFPASVEMHRRFPGADNGAGIGVEHFVEAARSMEGRIPTRPAGHRPGANNGEHAWLAMIFTAA